MQQHEQVEFIRQLGQFAIDQVRAATAPLVKKIAELEEQIKSLPAPKDGKDGVSITIEDVIPHVQEYIHSHVEQIRSENKAFFESMPVPKDGADGKSVDILDVVKELDAQGIVEKVTSSIPVPKDGEPGKDGADGKSVDSVLVEQYIREQIDLKVSDLPKPADGKDGAPGRDGLSVTIDGVMPEIKEFLEASMVQIRHEIASWPRPLEGAPGKDGKDGRDGADGKSISLDEIAPVVQSCVAEAVAELPVPRHVISCHISRDGHLHAVLSDGSTLDLGEVVGKDGSPGLPGKDGAAGIDGKNGADGIGFKDMSVTFDGERDFVFKFVLDERVEELAITVPFVLDRGVWKVGPYRRGDAVSWSGCQWIAQRDTEAQPGTVDSGWRLAVKKGRDGKDGDRGPPGPMGKSGADGRDLTQIGPDGKKWGV